MWHAPARKKGPLYLTSPFPYSIALIALFRAYMFLYFVSHHVSLLYWVHSTLQEPQVMSTLVEEVLEAVSDSFLHAICALHLSHLSWGLKPLSQQPLSIWEIPIEYFFHFTLVICPEAPNTVRRRPSFMGTETSSIDSKDHFLRQGLIEPLLDIRSSTIPIYDYFSLFCFVSLMYENRMISQVLRSSLSTALRCLSHLSWALSLAPTS